MKLWFILLLLAVVISAYEPRKSDRKSSEDDKDDKDDLPPLPTSEEEEKYLSSEIRAKRRRVNELKKAKKILDDDDESKDDDSQLYKACQNTSDELCHCEQKRVNCVDIALDTDDQKLRTTNLEISHGFVAEVVDFSYNGLRGLRAGKILPGHESQVKLITFLDNHIRTIEADTFKNFKSLAKLYLNDNILRSVNKDMFNGIGDTLHKLDLSRNSFKTLPNGVFSELTNLKVLALDEIRFSKLDKEMFRGLDNLETISLDYCRLESIPDDLFEYLPKLTGVSLEGNLFDEVPKALKKKGLKTIDLGSTKIVELREKAFGDNDNLEAIIMENSPFLQSIRDCAFCGLPKLDSVKFANSSIFEFHPNAFGNQDAKEDMKIAQPFNFDISSCNLTHISEDLLNWDEMESVLVGGNPWNCDCEILFMIDDQAFSFKEEVITPRCFSPESLKGRNLASLRRREVCSDVTKRQRVQKSSQIFVVLLLFVFGSVGIYYMVSSGKLQQIYRKNWQVPQVSYSNLNREEDHVNLQGDFNPRLSEV